MPLRLGYKFAALGLVAALVGLGWLTLACYQQRFADWAQVTVIADRAGLVMDKGAKVKMTGVTVGSVAGVDYESNRARLRLRIQHDALASIPANATVDITSSTVFGAKYVSLAAPAAPAAARLAPGAEIDISHVTVEINTVFEELTTILRTVDPERLDATLGALSFALQARGQRLGDALDRAAVTISRINEADPGVGDLLTATAPVTGLYADISPQLFDALTALTRTGHTLVDDRSDLRALLERAVDLSGTGDDLLSRNSSGFADTLRLWRGTAALLRLYSPEFPCLFKGMTVSNQIGWAAYNAQPGVKMIAGLIPGLTPYHYPTDLPKVDATGGPHCLGLPYAADAPYLVTDIGVNPLAPQRQGLGLREPDVVRYLLGLGGGR